MKERPIIFTGESVRAILDGRKSQTRRVMKPQPEVVAHNPSINQDVYMYKRHTWFADEPTKASYAPCPYGIPGDRLWVKETWQDMGNNDEHGPAIVYRATMPNFEGWSSPLYMPRWASRITLEVVNVRVERVQEISHEDAIAEGLSCYHENYQCALSDYQELWNKLNAGRGYPWASNPWVFVIEFRRAMP